MVRKKTICVAIVLFAILPLAGCNRKRLIAVGSKNFTEQIILGEITAQHLTHRLGAPVTRRLNLGGTLIVHEALMNGEIDVYPEYTGTAVGTILKIDVMKDPQVVFERVQDLARSTLQLEWLPPLGFNDTFAMVIRKDDADKYQIHTLSQALKFPGGWTLGMGYEFQQRADAQTALYTTYDLPRARPSIVMDLGLLYHALEQKQVNLVAANSTDGLFDAAKFTMLEDDRHAFLPYQACLVTRLASLQKNPALKQTLGELSGKISDEKMREMNYAVDRKHNAPAEVAAAFLRQASLTQ